MGRDSLRGRLGAAVEEGEISEEEARAGLQFHVTSTRRCTGCSEGDHRESRAAITKDNWAQLERDYRAKMGSLNERIEKFGLKRAFLCYWDVDDDQFANVRVYNLLSDDETREMLQSLRYGAPFQMIQVEGLEELNFMQRQVAAASSLLAESIADNEENEEAADESARTEADRMVAMVSFLNEGDQAEDVQTVQDMLPEHLRIPEDRIEEVTATFSRAEDAVRHVGDTSTNLESDEEVVRILDAVRGKSQDKDAARKRNKAKTSEDKARKRWGIKDKAGKWWRQRGQPLRWERLSVRYSMTRTIYNVPIFTPRIVRTHVIEEEDFIPEVDLDAIST
ncbi:Hypothetical Protein FCC1311_111572 [Hondaea fermentalgiana]|uniref:Uncharacterized protein n=1 Tax=Hondaea fermentalgiana TaxID=2315210 RepID=A0A2R5H3E4_9STRA|nr:Hypothetical Protein FCC1311_111572 [Hondaea fermentalgiana]|eukprot:GBG34934.1 Hypothetical Protein FCC1311_111572 [Hondaea fermentalgiana]